MLLFVPAGDKKKGLEQLTIASERGKYASVETTYFLMQIYFFYEKDYGKALVLARRLHGEFDRNVLFHRYVGRCYASLNNWQETRRVFGEVVDRAVPEAAGLHGERGEGGGVLPCRVRYEHPGITNPRSSISSVAIR